MMSGVVAAPSHEGKTIVIAVDNPQASRRWLHQSKHHVHTSCCCQPLMLLQVCVKAVDFVKHSFPQGHNFEALVWKRTSLCARPGSGIEF